MDFPERRLERTSPEKPAQSIQDSFLNMARKEKLHVTIYLVSGVKLTGRIKSFDKYSVLLETANQEQLIFKHAISTVVNQKIQPVAHLAPSASLQKENQPEPQAETTEA